MDTTRRRLFTLGVGAAGVIMAAPAILRATSRMLMPAAGGNRVVIVGGGWGGLSAARWLKRSRPSTEVVIVEQNNIFMSCPLSNLYLGNVLPLDRLQFSYAGLGRAGVVFQHARVTGVDRDSRVLETSGGKIGYDYLMLSPGIDYMWDQVPGLWEGRHDIPIAFKPGPEHLHLKETIDKFEGGVFALCIPEGPIRCPPGPYERIAMIAYNFKKRGLKAKLIVLDANAKPMSKGKGFLAAYESLYGDIVEYNPSHQIESVDHAKRRITHTFGDLDYDAANIIPPMQAGEIVRIAGVGKRWAPINATDFSTLADPRVFMIGDAIGDQPFPKSGFMANTVGKIAAAHVMEKLEGKDPTPIEPANTCFSMVDGDNGGRSIWVTHGFTWNAGESKFDRTATVDLNPTRDSAQAAMRWASSIWSEMLG